MMLMGIGHGVNTRCGDHTDLPTQIHLEKSRKVFFANKVYCFAGTYFGDWNLCLAKHKRVVLVSLMLITFRINQCIGQSTYIAHHTLEKAQTWQASWTCAQVIHKEPYWAVLGIGRCRGTHLLEGNFLIVELEMGSISCTIWHSQHHWMVSFLGQDYNITYANLLAVLLITINPDHATFNEKESR